MKKALSIILSLFNIMLLFGCDINSKSKKYSGEYPELYTIACNSIITEGYFENAQLKASAKVYILEEDDYGRKCFVYTDNDTFFNRSDKKRFFILISQYADNEYVYYYQNYNFIALRELTTKYTLFMDDVKEIFYNCPKVDIENLKIWNDWGKPIDESKCVKSKITNYYNDDFREYKNDYDKFVKCEDIEGYVVSVDNYGNKLICVDDNCHEKTHVFITSNTNRRLNDSEIIFRDLSKDYYLPFTKDYEYQDKLKQLKEENYWNVMSLDDVLDA